MMMMMMMMMMMDIFFGISFPSSSLRNLHRESLKTMMLILRK